ncbi:hypothetical protein IT575_15260 [bacterium]|nr:hypothetical protein [bacterium]
MDYRVCILAHPGPPEALVGLQQEALAASGLPLRLEHCPVEPQGLHSLLEQLRTDESCIGAAVFSPFCRAALAYSQHASAAAHGTGIADTLLRRRDNSLQADTAGVRAFVDSLREAGLSSARTALVLGGGNLARIALAGLQELGCQRVLIGYRHPRRPNELSSLFKHQRRNFSYFPLSEMQDFFAWADSQGLFSLRSQVPPPDGPGGKKRKDDQGFKRWDILVQATPVGLRPEEEPLVSTDSFLRCFNFVYDLVPAEQGTVLTKLAHDSGVPSRSGYGLLWRQAQYARELWLAQCRRVLAGEPDPPLEFVAERRGTESGQRRGWRGSRQDGTRQETSRDGRAGEHDAADKPRFVVKRRGS